MQKGVVRKRRPAPPSEYAKQLAAKQELKEEYGLREKQFKRYVKEILSQTKSDDVETELLRKLELRLDNVVFLMGLSQTRAQARQLVSHGHIAVQGKIVKIPSFEVKPGDEVSVRPQSLKNTFFKNVSLSIKKHKAPSWIELKKENLSAKIIRPPQLTDLSIKVDIPSVLEFYSKQL